MAEQTLEDYRRAQAQEWGTYVASEPIDINGARAFNVGDPVPASHVKNNVVPAEKVTNKASMADTPEV